MRELKLSQNKVTLVDDSDYDHLLQFMWYAAFKGGSWYAMVMRNKKPMYLHRYLMCPSKNLVVDHINRNSLDNQRRNLRIVSQGFNIQNRLKLRSNTSGYKGVSRHSNQLTYPWRAKIDFNHKQIYLGVFKDIKDAAKAYDTAALKYYGTNAVLNFPENSSEDSSI